MTEKLRKAPSNIRQKPCVKQEMGQNFFGRRPAKAIVMAKSPYRRIMIGVGIVPSILKWLIHTM